MKKVLALRKGDLVYRILEYLIRHPQACSTVSGIAEIWLGGEAQKNVEPALTALLSNELVQTLGQGSSTLYFATSPIEVRNVLAKVEEGDSDLSV